MISDTLPSTAPDDALALVQKQFFEIITRRLEADDRMCPHPASVTIAAPNRHFSSHERMEIYAQQYWWRLRHALDEDVPTLMRVLKPLVYRALRETYLVDCPSERFTLRDLGLRLPRYILEHPELAGSKPALACDAATFDFARVQAFDAPSLQPLTQEQIVRGEAATTRMGLQPHLQLCRCSYPVHELGEAGGEQKINGGRLRKQSTYLVVYRERNRVMTVSVSAQQFRLLEIIQGGVTIGEMAERVAAVRRFPIPSIKPWFWEWCSREWIVLAETE